MALNLIDNWQMAKILTDNWHLYPPIQTLEKDLNYAFGVFIKIDPCNNQPISRRKLP